MGEPVCGRVAARYMCLVYIILSISGDVKAKKKKHLLEHIDWCQGQNTDESRGRWVPTQAGSKHAYFSAIYDLATAATAATTAPDRKQASAEQNLTAKQLSESDARHFLAKYKKRATPEQQNMTYEQPGCRMFDPWTRSDDLSRLNNTSLVIVGDSLAEQLAYGIKTLLPYQGKPTGRKTAKKLTLVYKRVYNLNTFMTDDDLDHVLKAALEPAHRDGVLLLNLGVHYNFFHPCSINDYLHPVGRAEHCNLSNAFARRHPNIYNEKNGTDKNQSPESDRELGLHDLIAHTTRLMIWLHSRQAILPRHIFWLETTPQRCHSRWGTYDNAAEAYRHCEEFPPTSLSPSQESVDMNIRDWRNKATNPILQYWAGRFEKSGRLRIIRRFQALHDYPYHTGTWKSPKTKKMHQDCTHFQYDSAAWLEGLSRVLGAVAALNPSVESKRHSP